MKLILKPTHIQTTQKLFSDFTVIPNITVLQNTSILRIIQYTCILHIRIVSAVAIDYELEVCF